MCFKLNDDNAIRFLICAVFSDLDALVNRILGFLACKKPDEHRRLFRSKQWLEFSLENESKVESVMEKFDQLV
jgi:hypothetical protein